MIGKPILYLLEDKICVSYSLKVHILGINKGDDDERLDEKQRGF